MTAETFLLTLVGVLVVVYAFVALAAYLRKRGPQLIVPEREEAPAVAASPAAPDQPVATARGENARTHTAGGAAPVAPAGTRTGDLLRTWFAGKSCAICERPIPPIHRIEQHPGLMNPANPSRDLISWEEFARDQRLPEMLGSHLPVCSNCVMAESFRRKYPDLVVDRPEHGRHQSVP
jgi:hypothetical protein